MPTVGQGLRGIRAILEGRQVPDMASFIACLEPESYPFTQFLNALDLVVPCHNPIVRWMEEELDPKVDTLTANETAASLVLNVAHPEYFTVDDVVHHPLNGENMVVNTVNLAANTINVTRTIGITPAAAMVTGDILRIIGGSRAEGDVARGINNTLEVEQLNYTQIERTSLGATNTQTATKLFDGSDLENQAGKKLISHMKDIEQTLLFGQRGITTAILPVDGSTQYKRYCGGILEFIRTNRMNIGGILTESDFDAFCRIGFRYSKGRKLLLASPTIMQAVNNFAKDKLVQIPDDQRYGLALRDYRSPFGDITLANHWLLSGDVYGGYGILIDTDNCILRTLRGTDGQNRFAKRIKNIQMPSQDARQDEFLTEYTLQIVQEKTMALLTGVTG